MFIYCAPFHAQSAADRVTDMRTKDIVKTVSLLSHVNPLVICRSSLPGVAAATPGLWTWSGVCIARAGSGASSGGRAPPRHEVSDTRQRRSFCLISEVCDPSPWLASLNSVTGFKLKLCQSVVMRPLSGSSTRLI